MFRRTIPSRYHLEKTFWNRKQTLGNWTEKSTVQLQLLTQNTLPLPMFPILWFGVRNDHHKNSIFSSRIAKKVGKSQNFREISEFSGRNRPLDEFCVCFLHTGQNDVKPFGWTGFTWNQKVSLFEIDWKKGKIDGGERGIRHGRTHGAPGPPGANSRGKCLQKIPYLPAQHLFSLGRLQEAFSSAGIGFQLVGLIVDQLYWKTFGSKSRFSCLMFGESAPQISCIPSIKLSIVQF